MSANSVLATTIETTTRFAGRCPPYAVDCARIISAWEIVTLCIAVIAFIFQIALFNFILRRVLSRHENFSSSFYKLFCVLSFVEILHGLLDSFSHRVESYGLFLDFYDGNVFFARTGFLLSGYFSYFQCFAHLIIAANRYTVFAFPLTYKNIWKRKVIAYTLIANAILPLPFLSFRIPAETLFFYAGPNQLSTIYVDATIRYYAGLTSALISASTSLASAVLEILALFSYRKHTRGMPVSQESLNNLRLLVSTMLMLISQAILTTYHCLMMYGTLYKVQSAITIAQANLEWIFDQFCYSSSVCLFIVSRDVRRSCLKFYGLYRKNAEDTSVTIMSTN